MPEIARTTSSLLDTPSTAEVVSPITAPLGTPLKSVNRSVTRRSLVIGLILVAFVAAATPYNDYVLANGFFIGNHFPAGIFTLLAVLILLINPALSLLKKTPLAKGELITILTLMLVGAAVPSSGLMRYLESMVVTPAWHARDYPWLKPIADYLPAWLVPSRDPSSAIINNYYLGIDKVRGDHIPVLAFLLPQLLWGILIAALFGSALFLAALFRKQWVHHERLTFPLATIPLELMAEPELGQRYNALWRNPVLWAGAAIPLLVHLLAGLHAQYPSVPSIDLQYNVRAAFTDRPWDALPPYITQAPVYLAAVGICFFIPSEIAFSMWFFLLLNGALRVFFARSSFDPGQHEETRSMGVYVAYFLGLLWLARGHFKNVLAAAFRNTPRADDEPLSYRTMVLGYGISMAVAFAWLCLVGMSPLSALLLLGVGTMLVTLMARIVAETGLFFVGPIWWPNQFFSTLLGSKFIAMKSFFWTQVTSRIFFADLRETLMPFASNSMRLGQELKKEDRPKWFRWLAAALVLSVVVSGVSHHFLSYTYGRNAMADNWATNSMPLGALQETYQLYNSPADTTPATAWGHFAAGGLLATGLMVGRLLTASWPFHPIGLVLMASGPMKVMWFSIFLGWGAKRLLLRYGGAGAFRRARPFFIGLIVGETLAAGLWMFAGLFSNGHILYSFLPA